MATGQFLSVQCVVGDILYSGFIIAQIGVIRSYTMESTYCGMDQGPYMVGMVCVNERYSKYIL